MKKRMKIEVQKWGKSLVLQIPEAFVAETFLKPNIPRRSKPSSLSC